MLRRIALPIFGIIAGLGLFFWWLSYWPAHITIPDGGDDLKWRLIQKKNSRWERSVYTDDKKADFISYQQGGIILYGQGTMPEITKQDAAWEVKIGGGSWIIRSVMEKQTILIKGNNIDAVLEGIGGVFVDHAQELIANFDAEVKTGETKLLPSFLSRYKQLEFFDLGEQKDLIPTDLWLVYATFFPRDQAKVLGNISKKFLDTMIRAMIAREPDVTTGTVFKRDIRVKNALEEMQSIITKIDSGDSCGTDQATCFTMLDDILTREKKNFPEVFLPLEHAVRSWIQLDSDVQLVGYSWTNIFSTYHNQLLKGDIRARVVRDKSILEMIKSSRTVSSLEIWEYLTQMLASQKLGSAYSLQIVREMIRIGDTLQRSEDIPVETRKALAENAIESLSNVKNILENTYFTRKEYWFVLRTDLVDSEGNTIKNQVFINDLQELIKQIDSSGLVQVAGTVGQQKLPVIRAQLAWFNCIFSRNTEYVNNPRICRTTKT